MKASCTNCFHKFPITLECMAIRQICNNEGKWKWCQKWKPDKEVNPLGRIILDEDHQRQIGKWGEKFIEVLARIGQ